MVTDRELLMSPSYQMHFAAHANMHTLDLIDLIRNA